MLSLSPPFYVINGVTLFPDDGNDSPDVVRQQWYAAPHEPRLTMVTRNGVSRPVISLFEVIGDDGTREGYLEFDVHTGLLPDEQDEIESELQRLADLDERPRVVPVPLLDGTARLVMLGETPDVPSAAPVTPATKPGDLVVGDTRTTVPALYGDCRAVFSVKLDETETAIIDRALRGEMLPVGVAYALRFLGLRPAYRFTIEADWDRVQKHIETSVGSGSLFAEIDISNLVDELVEHQVITIDVVTEIPEDDKDSAAVLDQRDQMLDEFKSMITETFFEPTLDPISDKPTGWDEAAEGISSIRRALHSGSSGGLFHYKHADVLRVDRRTFDAHVTARTTVVRTLYPQAHLPGLAGVVTDLGLDIDDFVVQVTPLAFYAKRTVTPVALTDFAADDIASIHVRARYGPRTGDVMLNASGESKPMVFDAVVENGAVRTDVDVDFTVHFAGADTSERPAELTSPRTTVDTNSVPITPRTLYSVTPIPVRARPATLFDEFPQIAVQLRYRDDAHGIALDDEVRLDATTPSAVWKQFAVDPALTEFEYRISYYGDRAADRTTGWLVGDREDVVVSHPAALRETVSIVPPGDMTGVRFVFVDVSHASPGGGPPQEESVQFDAPAVPGAVVPPAKVAVELSAETPFLLTYTVSIVYADGRVAQHQPSMTRRRQVFVQLEDVTRRIVDVRPQQVPFGPLGVRELVVEMSVTAGANTFSRRLAFTAPEAIEYFEYEVPEGVATDYRYVVERRFTNGMVTRSVPATSDAGRLVIPVRA